MSGYIGGTGHGASEPSRRRARLRDQNGKAITQKAWIVALIDAAGERGLTQDEARPAYQRAGIQDSTFTGTRSGAHQDRPPKVVTLTEIRGEQAVYVTPRHVNGRKIEPFHPNTGGRRKPPSPTVLFAADRLLKWAERAERQLYPDPPDPDDVRLVAQYTKDQR